MRDLTGGPPLKVLLQFTLPLFVANLLQTAYTLVDAFWVGRLETEAVASISVSFVILFVLLSITWGMTSATTALTAQSIGARRPELVGRITGSSLILMALLGIGLATGVAILRRPLLLLLGAQASILPQAETYLLLSLMGIPITYTFTLISSVLRGMGDSLTPMRLMFISTLMNIILDPLLIFGLGPIPGLGILGAALATLLAQSFTLVWGLITIQSNPLTRLTPQTLRPDPLLLWQILRVGTPAAAAGIINSLSNMFLMRLVTPFGTDAIAAHGVGQRIDSIATMPAVAMGLGSASVIGQSLGADEGQRAYQTGLLAQALIFGFLAFLGALTAILAPGIIGTFLPRSPQLIPLGSTYLRIMALSYPFLGLLLVLNQMLRGAGDTVATFSLSLLSLWIIRLPLAFWLSRHLGAPGIWWGVAISGLLGGVLGHLYYRTGVWQRKTIIRRSQRTIS